jgi:plasmid maintenance system antidote protein VapI
MVRVPANRVPTHPGEILREEFLVPMGITQLTKYFGTTPGYWMNLQLRWDLYRAQQSEARQLEKIEPYVVSAQ